MHSLCSIPVWKNIRFDFGILITTDRRFNFGRSIPCQAEIKDDKITIKRNGDDIVPIFCTGRIIPNERGYADLATQLSHD